MKIFELRTLLTVTTGRLLTKGNGPRDNGIGNLYEVLGWMTNDSPMTHQLGRFSEECKPWLLRWFPELAEAEKHLAELDRAIECVKAAGKPLDHAIDNWISLCVADWGMERQYDVDRIPADDHDAKNAYDELVAMRGTDEGIVVVSVRE